MSRSALIHIIFFSFNKQLDLYCKGINGDFYKMWLNYEKHMILRDEMMKNILSVLNTDPVSKQLRLDKWKLLLIIDNIEKIILIISINKRYEVKEEIIILLYSQ